MCACEHHWDTNAPCTCNCPEHEGVRREMAAREKASRQRDTPDQMRFRVEVACAGYENLWEADVPADVVSSEDYLRGARDAALAIRGVL